MGYLLNYDNWAQHLNVFLKSESYLLIAFINVGALCYNVESFIYKFTGFDEGSSYLLIHTFPEF